MPALVKPLFRSDAIRPKLAQFQPTPAAEAARGKLADWVELLASPAAKKMKETELLGDFFQHVFVDTLGYVGPAAGKGNYTLKRESLVEVAGEVADAALGKFSTADGSALFRVAVEGKGPTASTSGAAYWRSLLRRAESLSSAASSPSNCPAVVNSAVCPANTAW